MTITETRLDVSQPPAEVRQARSGGMGCAGILLLTATSLWVLFLSVSALLSGWIIEQGLFDGSLDFPDIRWLVTLAYGMGLIIPLLILSITIKDTKHRSVYHTWLLAAIFSGLCFPTRLLPIPSSQIIGLLHSLFLAAFLAFVAIRRRKIQVKDKLAAKRSGVIGLAVSLGLIAAIPWVLWGALGSPLDSLIGLVTGILTGCLAAWLMENVLLPGMISINTDGGDELDTARFTAGRIVWLCFSGIILMIILVTGIAINGNQWILLISVPVTAIPGILFLIRGRSPTSFWQVAALVGLTTTWPLVWLDADELMLVSSSGQEELIAWSFRIAFLALLITLLASIVLFILNRRILVPGFSRFVNITLIGISGLILAGVYFLGGTPGFFGENWFVILKDQADLSKAVSITSYQERKQFVYDQLVEQAENSQKGIRRSLDRWGIDSQPYYLVNAIEVQGGPVVRVWLENRPEVDRVLPNPELRPLPNPPEPASGTAAAPDEPGWNLTMIHADKVWEMGYTGAGILVGQSDSGVQGDHPELADSYRGQNGHNASNWYDPWNQSPQPVDIGGHGTHTLATILGNSVGVAPDAEWIGCVNLARNLGNPAYYLDCWEFVFAPFPQDGDPFRDGDPKNGAMILNNSWGCPQVEGCDPATFESAARALRAAGIFTVVSAGNAGLNGCGSIKDPPAIYDEVYSVGAVTSSGAIANFSSLGPVSVDGSNRVKPDILAPGEEVLSAYPGNSYEVTSGTSMAGPHVVGVVALMWSANPELIGNVPLTENLINQTAIRYSGWNPGCDPQEESLPSNGSGYGVVDAYAAVQAARDLSHP